MAPEPMQPPEAPPNERPAREGAAADEELDDPPLVPPGNALRPRGLLWFAAGAVLLIVRMSSSGHSALSVPLGALATCVATFGLLDFTGTFDDGATPATSASLRESMRPCAALAASLIALYVTLRLSVLGVLPWPKAVAALLVTSSSLAALASTYGVLRALGLFAPRPGEVERTLRTRHGFWLLALGAVLYLPLLGSYSLIDPWETHYGEVAREMLARDDWISLWWAQDNWFWSKPVLDFWLQGLAFSLLGVDFHPDGMLAGVAQGLYPEPEWAVRLPGVVMTFAATYLAYRAVARVFGRRAGFLGGVVLLTTPYWFFLAHQSMTDMPYAAPLTAALALFALGSSTDPEEHTRVHALRAFGRSFGVSAAHLVLGLVIASALPQIAYLFSRHLTLSFGGHSPLLAWHWDRFMSGSGEGNCGLPGNEPCEWMEPLNRVFQPVFAGVLWSIALALFLYANRGERRVQRLYFIGAWYAVALSALAKGAPGLVLPIAIAVAALSATRRFADFARLELVSFLLMLSFVTLPWYVQAFMRHGAAFTDRLLLYDMYKRAFVHVHDTNSGDDVSFRYYLWQLGYGLFPWTGLAGLGFAYTFQEGDEAQNRRAELLAWLGLWFLVAFSLFSVSLTKFHHYALPAAPPLALLTGIVLARLFEAEPLASGWRASLRAVASTASVIFCVLGLVALSGMSWNGAVPARALASGGRPVTGALLLFVGFASFAGAFSLRERSAPEVSLDSPSGSSVFESAKIGIGCLLAAGLTALVGRDLFTPGAVDGPARLLHLFSYNYSRPWPATLDFAPVLAAFTTVAAVTSALGIIPRWRAQVAGSLVCLACVFCAFALDVYLVRVAPHWGQRETISKYYERRHGPEEPLVAYQMNWKGENFYTGNHLPAFVVSGARFKSWMKSERESGVRVMFFTTEHSRLSTLKSELGNVKKFDLLTTQALNNKFFLARVEL